MCEIRGKKAPPIYTEKLKLVVAGKNNDLEPVPVNCRQLSNLPLKVTNFFPHLCSKNKMFSHFDSLKLENDSCDGKRWQKKSGDSVSPRCRVGTWSCESRLFLFSLLVLVISNFFAFHFPLCFPGLMLWPSIYLPKLYKLGA